MRLDHVLGHTVEMSHADGKGSRNLNIYKVAHRLGLKAHSLTLALPYFEQREEGSQLRRSSKSVSSQIVEGYKLRKYRDEFLHCLHRAAASADESIEHLDYLVETGSLKDSKAGRDLAAEYDKLCGSISRFIMGVERDHSKPFYLRAVSEPTTSLVPLKSPVPNPQSPPPPWRSPIENPQSPPLSPQSAIRNPLSLQSGIRNPKSPGEPPHPVP